MSKDLPDFLGGEPMSDAAPAAEAPAAAAPDASEAPAAEAAPAAEPAPAEGPQRGPDGKFIAANPEAPPAEPPAEPVAEPAPAAPAPVEAVTAPLAALLDERDRRQASDRRAEAAEKEARELRQWRQQQEAAARRQPIPDREEDPVGFEAHRQAQIDSALYDQRLEMSRSIAEMKHGEEVTRTAFDWGAARCDQDPFFNEKVRASRNPVGFVVDEWKREQLLSRIDPKELDAFQEWKAQQGGAPALVSPPATPTPAAPAAPPAAPRASLAAAPSAGGIGAPAVGDAADVFDGMFRK